MKRRFHKKRFRRRNRSLNASNWWPFAKLIMFCLGILLSLAFLTLAVMVVLESVFHIDTPLPPDGIIARLTKKVTNEDVLMVTPTPYYTPEPTATPHPMTYFNPEEQEKEVVLSAEYPYYWFGDLSVHGNKMLFSAGKVVGDNVKMCALFLYDIASRSVEELPITPSNAHFVYPVFNDEWLVFLDGKTKGGGDICAYRFGKFDVDPIVIKTVYTGQPELRLSGKYLTWIERTGTSRDKLFVCDLETQETAVIAMFNASSYGTSSPYICDRTVIWAAEGAQRYEDGRMSSVIRHIDIGSSGIKDYNVDTYVHDPQFNGKQFVWIDAHHSDNSTLYISELNGDSLSAPKMIANGVVSYAMDDYYIAYSIDEAIYVYLIHSGESFRITPERELVQLLGASGGYVIWMDVTTRERDVLKYAGIPHDE